MKIAFSSLSALPSDVAVALVEGERECTLLLNENATVRDVAEHLHELVSQWASEEWLYVGRARDPHLRAVGD